MIKVIKTLIFVVLLLIPAIKVYSASTDLIEPQKDPWAAYEVLYSGRNQITLKVNGETFTVTSRFSMPNGTWNPDRPSTDYFNHTRTVDPRTGYIHIIDTFKNLTAGPLPIKQRHTSDLAGRWKKAWCAGIAVTSGNLGKEESGNPTSYAITDKAGIGFMPLNDEMQVHVGNQIVDDVLRLADEYCVIPSGGTYNAEWVIVPTQRSDFWDFVNACRRIRNVNFTLNYQFASLPTNSTESKVITLIRNKSANVVSAGLNILDGVRAHGTLFQQYLVRYPKIYADHNDRVRRLFPDVKPIVYFHCYLDNTDLSDPMTEYFNDRTLLIDGTTQATYAGNGYTRIFFPMSGNEWGKAMARNVDSILGFDQGDCKADGIYWDGMNWGSKPSKYHYGKPWDNISGDINASGGLVRHKSSVILLGKEWMVGQIQKIMRQGPLFTNDPPHIRSIFNLHFQGFAEYGGGTGYSRSIMYTPVIFGNPKAEDTVIDAYHGMVEALNYGCLYNWYESTILPDYETLTKYMFPITPIELREGYIIGEERIVTNRSGTYGWGDKSFHEVHVYGADGREVLNVKAPTKTTRKINGKIYTELQLAEGWSAAIIRRPVPLPWLILLLGD